MKTLTLTSMGFAVAREAGGGGEPGLVVVVVVDVSQTASAEGM